MQYLINLEKSVPQIAPNLCGKKCHALVAGAGCKDTLFSEVAVSMKSSPQIKSQLFAEQTKGQVPTVFPPRRITESP